ncbi:MAG: pyrroline-5-carboxylate reductase [Brevinematia bacterium]
MVVFKNSLGFIGFGNMGSALVKGILGSRDLVIDRSNIYVYDKDESKLEEAKSLGLRVLGSSLEIFNQTDVIFLCVKPKDLFFAMSDIKHFVNEEINKGDTFYLDVKKKVLVSILAGVKVSKIEEALGIQMPIVRVMPNTPAMVNEGAFGVFFPENVSKENRELILSIFNQVGKAIVVENEDLMDVVTGLSGSGPAYIFMIIEAMADGGVRMGLSRNDALVLSAQTLLGSAKMVLENLGKIHPEMLKDMVMSPAGTTAEGIKVLEENRIRFAFIKAIEEATKRARELSK